MSRGAFTPAQAISVPSVEALESITLADVPVGTIATVLSTGDTYVLGTADTWAAVGGDSGTGIPGTVAVSAAPATPSAGNAGVYVDSTSKNLAVKDDAGVVKHGVQSQTTAGLIVSTINDAGVVGTLSVAQARVLLHPTYYVTAAVAGQFLALTGLNGDVDGDYDMVGQLIGNHAGATYAFEPNNQTANLKAGCGDGLTGVAWGTAWNYPGRAGANPVAVGVGEILTFTGILTVRTGSVRTICVRGYLDAATDNYFYTDGQWTDTSTNLTTFRWASSQSDGFAAGSYLQLTARGRS